MELHLNGKTALVTGASAGIGRAIAKALCAEGVKVCVSARRGRFLEELASPVAGYLSGAVIPVDGGLRRHSF